MILSEVQSWIFSHYMVFMTGGREFVHRGRPYTDGHFFCERSLCDWQIHSSSPSHCGVGQRCSCV